MNESRANRRRHGRNPLAPQFTCCGVAQDVAAIEPDEATPVFADVGQKITCLECRKVIDWAQTVLPNYAVTR